MSLAPNFDDLENKRKTNQVTQTSVIQEQPTVVEQPRIIQQQFNTQVLKEQQMTTNSNSGENLSHKDFSPDGIITFSVIGCGGAGKGRAISYAKSTKSKLNKITTIDTSGVVDVLPNVDSYRIKDLNGSGKLRRENLEPITNFIADMTAKQEIAEVNVVIFSFSGGSGSLVGPMLIDEILRQGKIAIIIGIIDTDSEIDTINALNTLRTLDNIVDKRDGYVPTVLFDNRNGRNKVDKGIDITLANITQLLNTPYLSLDKQDRVKFLNPQVFDGISTGLKLLNLSRREDGEFEEDLGMVILPKESYEKIDSVLLISHGDAIPVLKIRCIVTFRGFYDTEGTNLIASLGYQIPDDFIKGLNAHIHSFKSVADKKKTKISSEYEIGTTDKKGLVL